ncbi:MAG: carbamoyl-phosphate synthase large subunit [Candidatus Marinimicrobia bacterium]|nr:carbamoyl-phosphate synthase large subunit [Candidatus Neomarinimicrobiota bacterium]MCF7840395.1 carbamoyl-phosphate synthase large subunit [Candidatus Neomarinimicrobiota bacterium]
MPKRTDIHSILILGAGPIVIGQGAEFDYSGTQACRALREAGYRVILVNSNPATIMTDKQMADATYLEPVIPETVASIIEKERPDAILPTVGGQTALDVAVKLHENGVLEKYGVELIGARIDAIQKAEDREQFKAAMDAVGIPTAKGGFVGSVEAALEKVRETGFPAIIRPSFTLGGTGAATAYNAEEFREMVENGLNASPIHEVLVEESLLGWKEFEMEVVRDQADNAIIICSIENVDPMGVHTGDSITVAPAQTLSDKEFQQMRNWSLQCLRTIGVDTGGSNVQFAVNPETGRTIIIEMNPRVSRSSALASKATGFPIAKIAAKLAVGYRLDELQNDITGTTLAAFEPVIDYVVTKIPRFDFEKFSTADGVLGVQMQSVGEVMAIGRTFRESLQKAFRSLEVGLNGLEPKDPGESRELDLRKMRLATAFRFLKIWQAFQQGTEIDEMHRITGIDPWFLNQIQSLAVEKFQGIEPTTEKLFRWKQWGYSDAQIGDRVGKTHSEIRDLRKKLGILPTFKEVDTCAAEFVAKTAYCYSTYETENEIEPLPGKKVLILGGGPNRIGQGIEFDYCCVQAVFGLQDQGYQSIMVNCNPETVSTDFDIADRLYFEPLTFEHVMNIVDLEQPDGVFVQFGGQTPLNIAQKLKAAGVTILGTSPDAIDLAENRQKFGAILDELDIPRPDYGTAFSEDEALEIAQRIGFPVLVRPSYVLGGRGMQVVFNEKALTRYMREAALISGDHPVLIDAFLENAYEFDVDALCDGESVYIGGIMQHIEEAGIHSGDSACVLPPYQLLPGTRKRIEEITHQLALALNTIGLINMQFAEKGGIIYVLEVNPRASRTVPFVSKVTDVPLARYAAQVAVGVKLKDLNLTHRNPGVIAVKKPVFPFNKFPKQGVFLSPEMKSIGEVIGLDQGWGAAYAKAELGAGNQLPRAGGRVFISVNDHDKIDVISLARDFSELGFQLVATRGTAGVLQENGIHVEPVNKVIEGRPHVVDAIKNGEIQLVVNTPLGEAAREDEFEIGRAAIRSKIPVITTLSGAKAALRGIRRLMSQSLTVYNLQELFPD